jgi:preprotein translocase subunit SecG
MRTILMFIHIATSLALISLVLLQHGRGADAGAAFGSGASQTLFGARGSSSFLTRATAVLATIFFTTSLTLAYLSGHAQQRRSVTELMAPVATSPAVPEKDESADLPTSLISDSPPVKVSEPQSSSDSENPSIRVEPNPVETLRPPESTPTSREVPPKVQELPKAEVSTTPTATENITFPVESIPAKEPELSEPVPTEVLPKISEPPEAEIPTQPIPPTPTSEGVLVPQDPLPAKEPEIFPDSSTE